MARRSPPVTRTSKRPSYSDLVILFFLYEGEKHSGYSMKALLANTRVHEWLPVSNMTVYQSFKRLEQNGCVSSEAVTADGTPDRTLYAITEGGRAFFEKWQRLEMQNFQRDFFHFDIGVGLSSFTPPDETVTAATRRIEQLQERLQKVKDDLEDYSHSTLSPFPRWLLLDHERSFLIGEIRWLRRFIRLVTKPASETPASEEMDAPFD